MKAMANFVQKLRGVNHVVRWNMHPTIRKENVAEHSFWVAIFTSIIANDSRREALVFAALVHDAEEAVTGDLPALVKGRVPRGAWDVVVDQANAEVLDPSIPSELGANAFTALVAAVGASHDITIKCADLLAALMFARMEIELGNSHFGRIECELLDGIEKTILRMDPHEGARAAALVSELGFSFNEAVDRPTCMSHL